VIWLNPAALFSLVAAAAPILIHILAQRRAERLAFPTLRFLRPTRLAAIRRRVLEDPLLLAVRVAIVAAAVAAVAGPLVVTPGRRSAWNERVARASVMTTSAPATANGVRAANGAPVFQARDFRGLSIADGVRRAVDWLERNPPARRELVVTAPLTIGSLSAADLAAVPPDVGIFFERMPLPPPTRTIGYGRVRSTAGTADREVTLAGAATSVRDVSTIDRSSAGDSLPIEVVSSEQARPSVEAALAAVLSQRVWSPPSARHARLIVADAANVDAARAVEVSASMDAWMGDAVARITRDADFQQAASVVAGAMLDDRFSRAPWQTLAMSAGNRPVAAAAAAGDWLVIVSGASPDEVFMPILVRALVNAIAVVPDLAPFEVVGISDQQLNAWSRPAGAPATPRNDAIEADDRRWLWLGVLGLLALETWLRRSRGARRVSVQADETVRVA